MHRIIQSQDQYSTILQDFDFKVEHPFIKFWAGVYPIQKSGYPCFFSQKVLFMSKEIQGKSAYLLKDCLVRVQSEEGGTSSRPTENGWSLMKYIHHWMDHVLKNRLLWLSRFRASFRTGHQLRSWVPNLCLLFLLFVFPLSSSLKDFHIFFKICKSFFHYQLYACLYSQTSFLSLLLVHSIRCLCMI